MQANWAIVPTDEKVNESTENKDAENRLWIS